MAHVTHVKRISAMVAIVSTIARKRIVRVTTTAKDEFVHSIDLVKDVTLGVEE